MASASDQRGQATAEYAGLVLLVAFLGLAPVAGIGPVAAGGAVVRTLAESIACTVAGRDCEQETAASALRSAYGPELAGAAIQTGSGSDYVVDDLADRELRDGGACGRWPLCGICIPSSLSSR